MGQVESQPPTYIDQNNEQPAALPQGRPWASSSVSRSPNRSSRRKSASADNNDTSSQHSAAPTSFSSSSYSQLASKAARAPLNWAAQGAELVATTTITVAVSTYNVALKTTSAFASSTESAANIAAQNLTHVSIKTANVATQTASIITSATSASVKSAGDAIAGTANLVVEGFTPQDNRSHIAFASLSSSSPPPPLSPQVNQSPKFRPASRSHDDSNLLFPEAMVSLGAHDNNLDQSQASRNMVGSRFWDMLGSTNESARRHWVATVTSTKSTPPSTKYFRKIVILAYETKGQSVNEFYKMLLGRPLSTSSICALKALITCLRLVREGPPEALAYSIANIHFVDSVGAFYAERVLLHNASSDALNEYMLIARLSGFIVQKMHFHSLQQAAMNSRYEPRNNAREEEDGGVTATMLQGEDEDDEFERLVQLASSLLTLLGTMEGVTRLALTPNKGMNSPSPMALLLSTLLIEESLGAFDSLSAALAGIKAKQQASDTALVKSLSTRHQNTYEQIRLYCLKALEFPYVVALNKVPMLSKDTLGVVQRLSPTTTPLSPVALSPAATTPSTGSGFSPWGLFSYASTDFSKSTSSLLIKPPQQPQQQQEEPTINLLLRSFTQISILEGLEEEEKLMDTLVSHKSPSATPHPCKSSGEQEVVVDVDTPFQSSSALLTGNGEDWYEYSSIENAKPPPMEMFEPEDDEYCDDGQEASSDASPEFYGGDRQVRTTTQGNPFDTGNSSIIMLAIAHRSAFSGITNPFASGQFNVFSTNAQQYQQEQQQQPAVSSSSVERNEDEASRALEQCERLFEFSGIKLPQQDVEISNEVIGRGAFSIVFRGKMTTTGEDVAVKELSIEEWGTTSRVVMDFRAEVALMKAVHHPNVLRLIGACASPKLRLVSEYCHHGNLFDFLYFDRCASPTASRVLTWSLKLRLALGEARGMHFLHSAFPVPLIHRDLKSLNLLLSKTYQLKVSDFGLSRFRAKKKTVQQDANNNTTVIGGGPCGTTHWMAPEVIEGNEEYDEKADIYSFAVNLWELCTRRIPWEGEKDVKRLVVAGQRLALNDTVLDPNCPPALLDLIELCWHKDPKKRPDFGVICKELKRISKTVEVQEKKLSGE